MSCQIAFVYGDQVAAFELDSKEYDKFNLEALRQKAATLIDLGAGIALTQVFFTYEDDDGDKVTIGHDADVSEAITVHEDAGVDHILLNVVLRKSGATFLSEGETDWSDKEDVNEEKEQVKVGSFFSESFVLEVVQFMSDEAIKRLLPEMAAFVSFEVMKRSSSQAIVDALVAKYPILASTNLFKVHWPFLAAWAAKFDAWLKELTEDQVAKVAFQVPIVTARLVAKRKRLYQHLFVKQRPMTKLLKMKQFDLGDVDFGFLLENAAKDSDNVTDATAHVGRSCSVCSVNPIEGVRYKCLVCADYDLCEACEAGGVHPADHAMMKFRTPAAGYVGIAVGHLDKKVHKHHLKAMKKEMKLSKKIAKMEKKHGKHREKDTGCLLATAVAPSSASAEPPAYHIVGNAGDNDSLKTKKSPAEQKRPY